MQLTKARIHVTAYVPPGDSLLGILPHNTFRVERVKLMANEYLQLLTVNHEAVPFDGGIHDLRSKNTNGQTLTIGNHLSLFIRNLSTGHEHLELQVGGTTVTEGESPLKGPSPVLGHKLVLGVFAQEVVDDRFLPTSNPGSLTLSEE